MKKKKKRSIKFKPSLESSPPGVGFIQALTEELSVGLQDTFFLLRNFTSRENCCLYTEREHGLASRRHITGLKRTERSRVCKREASSHLDPGAALPGPWGAHLGPTLLSFSYLPWKQLF